MSDLTTNVFEIIQTFLTSPAVPSKFVHIAGANQTGKSCFVKDFLHYALSRHLIPQARYIDTEVKFASQNYNREFDRAMLDNLLYKSVNSMGDLASVLRLMNSQTISISPGELIIIDSLSEVLKGAIANTESGRDYRAELKQFYITIIAPILQLAHSNQIGFICTHHNTYNKEADANLPYEHSIMERLPGLWIYLSKTPKNEFISNDQNRESDTQRMYEYNMKVVYWSYASGDHGQTVRVNMYQKAFGYEFDQDHLKIIQIIKEN